ncbi:histidinol-phosphate aminotransferase HisC [Gottschalkia purinilytica]|uniref:Histidinol-phosphate aminotransferase n=1 Tax=Gottschalkia purinilytica TaxID=1503 RepID=A0A0L0WFH1_GOTPU|nr:histidinol-phosphate transaminase [Gottschalkia purinilytica]KNF10170.1 histidinol-phosphate aminotransferase HisC [Gottschalkia purinilytica]
MINSLIKESVKDIKPYIPHDYEHKYKMDANENPYELSENILKNILNEISTLKINRYPDTNSVELRKEISKYIEVDYKNIVIGNGSDEMISVIIDTFVEKEDIVISHYPTFAMYDLVTKISGANYVGISTDENFDVNIEEIIKQGNDKNAKIIFLCNPNNPTGNIIKKDDIIKVINETRGIVVVDEAYIEFGGESVVKEIYNYERLIVLRTFSKAFGAAGIRTGYLIAGDQIVEKINAVKPPYNINSISQVIAIELMKNRKEVMASVEKIKYEREKLLNEMEEIDGLKAYRSYANSIIFRVKDNKNVFYRLLEKGIMVRYFSGGKLDGCLRVSIGTEDENSTFINALKEVI